MQCTIRRSAHGEEFVGRVGERAVGRKVLDSLSPDQQVIKIVNEELIVLLGGTPAGFDLSASPASVLVCGLQGAGKTSFCAKLAVSLMKRGRNPLLVAADVYRPAAIEHPRDLEQRGRARAVVERARAVR